MKPGDRLQVERGDVVVCIPLYGGPELFEACLRSVLAHTAPTVPILVCDDASPEGDMPARAAAVLEAAGTAHAVHYVRRERNLGFPANANGAFVQTAPADVVILNSDCVVSAGWLAGLRAAAASDSRVATVSTLTNHGSLLSVPERNHPHAALPQGWDVDRAATAVREHALGLRPVLPTAVGHCLYVRRAALELVGDFDLAFSPGYGEEVDFSQRCVALGLTHVLADEVFVEHRGGASLSPEGAPSPHWEAHDALIQRRYPYYHDAVRRAESDVSGPLGRALGAARRALSELSVLVDGRVLSGALTGTQIHVLELLAALARSGRARVGAIVPDRPGPDAGAALRRLDGVAMWTRRELEAAGMRADLVHRPYQADDEEDLSFLAGVADRLVITQQDLIGYHNPAYFRDGDAWQGYRRITRTALAVADRVVLLTPHARADVLAEDLLEPERAVVVPIGADHRLLAPTAPLRPARAAGLQDGVPVLLCVGTDFAHKNRVFALEVLNALMNETGWHGRLVFAGPRVSGGSSRPREEEWLAAHPGVARAVLDLGAVSEAEKAWLYARAGAVLYPTVHEGFGLVPFEAAEHGVPCLWAPGTSLSDVLPDAAAAIVPWDPVTSAARLRELLTPGPARQQHVQVLRTAAARFTWDAAAAALIDVYRSTCESPSAVAGALQRRYGEMAGRLSEDAMRLVGPSGALPADMERPLLALATHGAFSRPLFGAIRFGYRAGYRLARLGGRSGGASARDSTT